MKSLINQEEKYDQIEMSPNQLKIEETQDEVYSNSNQIIQSQSNDTKKTNKWTQKEDEALKKLVQSFGEKNWRKISGMMEGRSAIQCLHRWSKILKPGLVKGPWTADEDEKLIYWVQQYGPYKWSQCSELITGRSGKQCRERWFNNLNPNVKKGNWTQEEDNAIFRGYLSHGSSWSKIAKNLEGRTENSVKNRFYSTVRKLLSDMEKKGKYVNQDNECDIKNIIQQSLSEYSSSQNMIKLLNEELDQENQQRRKSSTTVTNSASIQDCNEINMNLTLQTQESKGEHKEQLQKLDIQNIQDINNESNDIIQNITDDLSNQNQKNQIIAQKNPSDKEILLQTSDNFQQDLEKDDIQKDQYQILNKDFPQNQQYENGNHEQINRQNIEEKLQKQNNSISPQNIVSQQQNQLQLQNPTLQSQQLQIKLKDEYSQQNCLYRLILEGNVSIKKTTSMRDYSLYQKNKAKTRSKKYQKESSDDFKKNMQTDDASPSSQRSQDQYPISFNAQNQIFQNGLSQKGSINYELSKEEKMMVQVSQFHNDIPQNQLKVFNEQMFIKQTISQQEQNNKNTKSQKKQILSQLGKNSSQVQNGKNNNSNLSYLLKEKLMSINQLSKLKNSEQKREDSESRDDSLSQVSSEANIDFQPKKGNSKQSIPTVLEQAQKLQKEIEEKQKQLLMLSLEGKVDKKKQKKGYYDQIDESKLIQNKQIDGQQKLIKVKEEYQDDEYSLNKDKSEFKNSRKQQKPQKVQIDHEQQKQLLQKMLQSQQNKKLNNQNEVNPQSKEENLPNNKLNNFNKKLQSQLKILNTLNTLKLQNKFNKNYDSSESDDLNFNTQKSEGEDDQIDEDNFNKNELGYDQQDDDEEEEEGEEEDDDDDEDEDDNDEEDDDEYNKNGTGSKQISNKLMKYLSSSFAKLMHSITQKYSKKYQIAKQNKANKKNQMKQQAHKQKSLDQLLQAQQYIQKNNNNLSSQKYINILQNQNVVNQKNKNQNRNNIQQFEKNNNKKQKKDVESNSQSENKIQNNIENNNKLNQKLQQQIIEGKDNQSNQINNVDFNQQQSLMISQQQKYIQQELNKQENQQSLLLKMDASKKQQAKKNKTQNTQSKQLQENTNDINKQNQNSQMEIESMSLSSDKSVKLGQETQVKDENKNNIINKKKQIADLNKNNSGGNILQQDNFMKDSDFSLSSQIQQNSSQENIRMNHSYPQINGQSNIQLSQVSQKDQSSIYTGEILNLSQESFAQDLSKQNLNQNGEKLKYNTLDSQMYKMNNPISNNMAKVNNSNNLQNKSVSNQKSNINQANAFLSIMSQIPQDASKSDDRIDYLISQLQSLETLLNTTKQELNKLESTIKEPDPNTQQNQSPTLLHNDEMSNMGILSNHNLNFINFNQYHNPNLSMQQTYNHSDELDSSLIHQSEYKQSNLKQLSKYHSQNSQNQKLHNNLMQNSYEGSSNHSHNINQTQDEEKMHDNNQNHISDIHSIDFAFDNKYSNEDMNYIGGQEHEKDLYHLGNISPSPIKNNQYRHKDNNQHNDSSQNMQEKSADDIAINEETESDNSYLNKKDSSKMDAFKVIA
ncbi:Myb-like DNA-binding domain protein (macronuclear) [Tetrahymena thermophila SB210]|uniref:Myb-like DNA-binding domain protein n=1 Tax=Tetrahymena thermophila (strain SB210) TaxID=312017 RepID=I7MJY0_TETTS|nr:Myb-like DNA-binding domain protein [Tetrahymena thermophila SB210]EAS07646.1 Myb-like DNA-binding domain protein [Tetrahymena thermophila SB210]|eukprot:XP_001027888.1 Myb-like DNA-binding domain protein [Tetrahymena thermophila SB210]